MDAQTFAFLFEFVLIFGGITLWIQWQLRDLDKRAKAREAEKQAAATALRHDAAPAVAGETPAGGASSRTVAG